MARSPVDLSVVVPAYNEEMRLPASFEQAMEFFASQQRNCELILSDDGSTDGTLDLMRNLAERSPVVRVVTHPTNRGKGRALAEGIAISTGRLVLITDADLSAPLDELPKLEEKLDAGAGVAIGSRAHQSARELQQPIHRKVMGKTFNFMVQALLLPGIWDTQCGFKLFRGDSARGIFGDLRTDGFAYDVEVLVRARRQGLQIAEVPVRWTHSAPTRVPPIRSSIEMFIDLLKIRLGL